MFSNALVAISAFAVFVAAAPSPWFKPFPAPGPQQINGGGVNQNGGGSVNQVGGGVNQIGGGSVTQVGGSGVNQVGGGSVNQIGGSGTNQFGGGDVNQCNTGPVQCCDNVQQASHPSVFGLLGQFGFGGLDPNTQVGTSCNSIDLLGFNKNSCNAEPVCCENNSFNGLIAIGCSPININL